jgi:hypothetical protein
VDDVTTGGTGRVRRVRLSPAQNDGVLAPEAESSDDTSDFPELSEPSDVDGGETGGVCRVRPSFAQSGWVIGAVGASAGMPAPVFLRFAGGSSASGVLLPDPLVAELGRRPKNTEAARRF